MSSSGCGGERLFHTKIAETDCEEASGGRGAPLALERFRFRVDGETMVSCGEQSFCKPDRPLVSMRTRLLEEASFLEVSSPFALAARSFLAAVAAAAFALKYCDNGRRTICPVNWR